MRRRNRKKEKFVMLLSSLFVLSALTLTGIYVKERTKIGEENTVDFGKLNDTAQEKTNQIGNQLPDSDSAVEQANASKAINPTIDKDASDDRYQFSGVPVVRATDEKQDETEDGEVKETSATPLHFSEETGLTWPIVGNVLINFSMDKTVYFATLDQYRYSPALVIEATEGEQITSAAPGKVSNVFYDTALGNCVSMDLGDGYELTYGQLKDIGVTVGDYVDTGALLGSVAAPSKYYSVEGANVYFKLTKNGEPINPLNRLS